MVIDSLLDRLDGVRRYGKGYRARCPSCNGARRDVLSLMQTDDGAILLHCFHGCTAAEVVQAVGLTLGDLFPERITTNATPEQRRANAREYRMAQWKAALEVLAYESMVIETAAEQIMCAGPLSPDELHRVHEASARIHDARTTLTGGSHAR